MAETDVHRQLILEVTERLIARYADRSDAYVSGNLFVYYSKGEPKLCLAPDAFVVFGATNKTRRSYKVWEEGGHFPDVVFEFTSARTQDADLENKFAIYEKVWRVKEYFLFDPLNEYLDPPLLGYRLTGGEFVPIDPVEDTLTSEVLGITISRQGTRLALRDAATGADVLTRAERKAAEAERQAAEVRQRATAAEAEIARLKAELDALRRSHE